jgi:Flp pilus assembly protein TadG
MNGKDELNRDGRSIAIRVHKNQRGQVLPMVAVFMVGFFGMCAFSIDVGRVYFSYNELQATTDAAALAGAQGLPTSSTAISQATQYSSVATDKNAFSNLPNVTITATPKCYTVLQSQGLPCDGSTTYNAIQVKQTMAVPMTFARLFGTNSVSITSTATAAMRGAATVPYNVALIIDTTQSMTDPDTGSNCTTTRIACALTGAQTLLGELYPCSLTVGCGTVTGGVATNSFDRVSLFTFPNMVTTTTVATVVTNSDGTVSSSTSTTTSGSTVANDYTCPTSNPSIDPYTFPSTTANTLSTMPYTTVTTSSTGTKTNKKTTTVTTTDQVTYQITPYLSDYRSSDSASTLNTASIAAIAAGAQSGCSGVKAKGGQGTYYAGAIYAAHASLLAEQAANPGSQNVIILISDGDASATGTGSTPQMAVGTTSTTVATSNGVYPSWKNECAQAVTAAAVAKAAGTKIYTIAYGSTSSGCSTDSPAISPCNTMKSIASTPLTTYFYSDYQQSGGGTDTSCIGSADSTTNINQIFTDIGASFTVARLIPDNLASAQ